MKSRFFQRQERILPGCLSAYNANTLMTMGNAYSTYDNYRDSLATVDFGSSFSYDMTIRFGYAYTNTNRGFPDGSYGWGHKFGFQFPSASYLVMATYQNSNFGYDYGFTLNLTKSGTSLVVTGTLNQTFSVPVGEIGKFFVWMAACGYSTSNRATSYSITYLDEKSSNWKWTASSPYEALWLSFYNSTVTDRSTKNNAVTVVADGGYPTFSNDHGGVVTMAANNHMLTTSVVVGANWTIEATVVNPVGTTGTKTLISGAINKHVVVKNGKLGSQVGTTFYDSGFSVASLKSGPFKLTVTGTGTTTKFFVNGRLVGSVATKVADDITTLGNFSTGSEQFGTFGNIVVNTRCKTDKEVTAEQISVDYARVS